MPTVAEAQTGNVAINSALQIQLVDSGATNDELGTAGAAGDYLAFLLVIPASTSPGAIDITDGDGTAITVFNGGASSISNLIPFAIPIQAVSTIGAWSITTGNNLTVLANGSFTNE